MSLLLRRAFSTAPRFNLAKMTIIGRLGNDPEFSTTSTGKAIGTYSVASGRGEKPSWFSVVDFAENKNYISTLKKGDLVYVEADVSTSTFEVEGQLRKGFNIVQSKSPRAIYGANIADEELGRIERLSKKQVPEGEATDAAATGGMVEEGETTEEGVLRS